MPATAAGESVTATTRTLRRRTSAVILIVGVVCVAVGAVIGAAKAAGTAFIGVGTSLVAAVVFAYLAFSREEALEDLQSLGVREVFSNRQQRCDDAFWQSLIQDARTHYRVLGVGNHGFISTAAKRGMFTDEFRNAIVQRQISVEFLWLNPRSELAEQREREDPRATRSDTRESILWLWELRESLAPGERDRLKLFSYELIPTCGVTSTDRDVVVTQYLTGSLNQSSPGLILMQQRQRRWPRGTAVTPPLSQPFLDYYQEVRSKAQEIDGTLIQELRDHQFVTDKPSESGFRPEAGGDV